MWKQFAFFIKGAHGSIWAAYWAYENKRIKKNASAHPQHNRFDLYLLLACRFLGQHGHHSQHLFSLLESAITHMNIRWRNWVPESASVDNVIKESKNDDNRFCLFAYLEKVCVREHFLSWAYRGYRWVSRYLVTSSVAALNINKGGLTLIIFSAIVSLAKYNALISYGR